MDFHETLQALKDRADAGQVVEVHAGTAGDDASPPPVLMQGVLSTKWHPEMTDPPPMAIFFVGEAQWSSFVLTEDDFERGEQEEGGAVRVVSGGMVIDVREATLLEELPG